MIKGKFSSGKQLYTFQAEDLCDFLGSTQLHSFSQSVQSLHVSLCLYVCYPHIQRHCPKRMNVTMNGCHCLTIALGHLPQAHSCRAGLLPEGRIEYID